MAGMPKLDPSPGISGLIVAESMFSAGLGVARGEVSGDRS
jgi:hypothetical protein